MRLADLVPQERIDAARQYFAPDRQFYAACEDGHIFWSSSPAPYNNAVADGQNHDKTHHGGKQTAYILPL